MQIPHLTLVQSSSFKHKDVAFKLVHYEIEPGLYAIPPRAFVFDLLYIINKYATDYKYGALSWYRLKELVWCPYKHPDNPRTQVLMPHTFSATFAFNEQEPTVTEYVSFANKEPVGTSFMPKTLWTPYSQMINAIYSRENVAIEKKYIVLDDGLREGVAVNYCLTKCKD